MRCPCISIDHGDNKRMKVALFTDNEIVIIRASYCIRTFAHNNLACGSTVFIFLVCHFFSLRGRKNDTQSIEYLR
jgi:hypothetical protein